MTDLQLGHPHHMLWQQPGHKTGLQIAFCQRLQKEMFEFKKVISYQYCVVCCAALNVYSLLLATWVSLWVFYPSSLHALQIQIFCTLDGHRPTHLMILLFNQRANADGWSLTVHQNSMQIIYCKSDPGPGKHRVTIKSMKYVFSLIGCKISIISRFWNQCVCLICLYIRKTC